MSMLFRTRLLISLAKELTVFSWLRTPWKFVTVSNLCLLTILLPLLPWIAKQNEWSEPVLQNDLVSAQNAILFWESYAWETESAPLHYHLFELFRFTQQPEEAARHLQQATAINPQINTESQ